MGAAHCHGFLPGDVAEALRAFCGLPGVSVEKPALLAEALAHAARGMDLADALHLAAASHCKTMVTFDRRFIDMAEDTAIRVLEPREIDWPPGIRGEFQSILTKARGYLHGLERDRSGTAMACFRSISPTRNGN